MAKKTVKEKVIIRRMTIDDLPVVYHIGEQLFTSREAPLLYRTWDEYEIVDVFNTDPELCLVAELNGEVVGFIIGTTIEKPGTAWKYGYVTWIGVKKAYQKMSVGSKLYKSLEKKMREIGVRMMIVDTEESNREAISFFRRVGFNEAKGHIWMTKVLKGKHRVKHHQY